MNLTDEQIDKMKKALLDKKKRKSVEKRGKTRPHKKELSMTQKNNYRIRMSSKGELPLRNFCWLRFKDLRAAYNTVEPIIKNEVVMAYLVQTKMLRITQGEDKFVGEGLSRRKVEGRKRYYVQQAKQEEFIEFIRVYFIDERYDGYKVSGLPIDE